MGCSRLALQPLQLGIELQHKRSCRPVPGYPFYIELLNRKDLSPEVTPEPPIGTTVTVRFTGSTWRRRRDGWNYDSSGIRRSSVTWERLNQTYGPFNIVIPG